MSVDVTTSNSPPVVLRRRVQAMSDDVPASSAVDLPTLLRVPDMQSTPDSGTAARAPAAATSAAPSRDVEPDEDQTEAAESAAENSTAVLDSARIQEKPDKSNSAIALLRRVKLENIKVAARALFSNLQGEWRGRVSTIGAIAAAIIACTLVARALRQDPIDTNLATPELTAQLEPASGAAETASDLRIASLEGQFDNDPGQTETPDAAYDNIPNESREQSQLLVDGQSGATQVPSGFGNAASSVVKPSRTPPLAGESPLTPAASAPTETFTNAAAEPPAGQRWDSQTSWEPDASSPRPNIRLNQPWQPTANETPMQIQAKPQFQERPVTSVRPDDVWPPQSTTTNRPTGIEPASNNNVRVPQARNYPSTDVSRFVPLSRLKTDLYEQKRSRQQQFRVADQQSYPPTARQQR